VSLSARAAAAHGTITGFRWFFGDGGTAGRRVSKHTFKRAGRYRVVLRVVDSAENWTQVSRTVVVRRR
jgi:PKD repeat protein